MRGIPGNCHFTRREDIWHARNKHCSGENEYTMGSCSEIQPSDAKKLRWSSVVNRVVNSTESGFEVDSISKRFARFESNFFKENKQTNICFDKHLTFDVE